MMTLSPGLFSIGVASVTGFAIAVAPLPHELLVQSTPMVPLLVL